MMADAVKQEKRIDGYCKNCGRWIIKIENSIERTMRADGVRYIYKRSDKDIGPGETYCIFRCECGEVIEDNFQRAKSEKPPASKFTKEVRQFIIRKTAVVGINNLDKFLSQYGAYMTEALERLDAAEAENKQLVTTIEEVIELMDEEPAKEILKKAVT